MSTQPDKPNRRWLRLSLRTLLVLLTVGCVWLGWFANRANQQRQAVQWIEQSNGFIIYENTSYPLFANPFDASETSEPLDDWLLDLIGTDYFCTVVEVCLNDQPVYEVTPLTNLTKLRDLGLSNTQVHDVTTLANLKNLQSLDLDNTQVRDLTPLANLSGLVFLSLRNTKVSRENCRMLQKSLPSLKILGP